MGFPDTSHLVGITPATGLIDTEPRIDMERLRGYRLERVQELLRKHDYGAVALFDPINTRYATGTRNMAVYSLHNPCRLAFVPAEGKAIMFEYPRCMELSRNIETIGEVRPATMWNFYSAGDRIEEWVELWADELSDVMLERCINNRRLAFDQLNFNGARALEARGVELFEGQGLLETARAIKSVDELACMSLAVGVAEIGMARMYEALKPGITENELWSILHQTNIAMGGEWIETRLLSSGGRTNPWWQESSDKVIRPGELVGLDTDMIGPFGYCADVSRTFFCGPGKPTKEQKRLYKLAYEHVQTNIKLLKPGMSFREFSEKGWRVPSEFFKNRYSTPCHGVGMCDEWPRISFPEKFDDDGYNGIFEPNMTVSIESYIGAEGGAEGVKLEEQVLITETGAVPFSTFPFEEILLA